jgi:superfamily II DNA/RNA helicase
MYCVYKYEKYLIYYCCDPYSNKIIFVLVTATNLAHDLNRMGMNAQCLHSDHSQAKREQTLRLFRKGTIKILVVSLQIFLFFFC